MTSNKWKVTLKALKKLGIEEDKLELERFTIGGPPRKWNPKSPVGGARLSYYNIVIDTAAQKYFTDNLCIAAAYLVAVLLYRLPAGDYHYGEFDGFKFPGQVKVKY